MERETAGKVGLHPEIRDPPLFIELQALLVALRTLHSNGPCWERAYDEVRGGRATKSVAGARRSQGLPLGEAPRQLVGACDAPRNADA
jgi:hypothetical protein